MSALYNICMADTDCPDCDIAENCDEAKGAGEGQGVRGQVETLPRSRNILSFNPCCFRSVGSVGLGECVNTGTGKWSLLAVWQLVAVSVVVHT